MADSKTITLPSILTVKQLADSLEQPVTAIIAKLMGFGVLATINEDIDFDTAAIVADDFGVAVEKEKAEQQTIDLSVAADESQLENRPPIVTIMGHVDHGKTTLLDTIRKTNVAAGEAGGITQHISSYQIEITPRGGGEKRLITFLDTPGHSAFEAMRRHGARITDLVVLVVAADDGVKPQTVEAINHAKQMKVPVMVAINKIDKPTADIERVKAELSEHGLVPEDWGGKTVVTPVSALENKGIDDLLEVILLSTDLRDLKANPHVPAVGVVIESHLEPGIGSVATVLVQNGLLKIGDYVAIGDVTGKVRALTDHRGKRVHQATPSTPVEVSGLSGVPQFGEQLVVFGSEKEARESARQYSRSHSAKRAHSALSASAHQATQKEGERNILHVVVKADTKGSLEAIADTLQTMQNEDVEVRMVGEGVGDISENDINLAHTSKALVIGFQVRLPAAVKSLADREHVAVSLFSVVYELFDAIRSVLADLMPMVTVERQIGQITILARFRDNRKNVIIGGRVEEGVAERDRLFRVTRGAEVIAEGKAVTVRRGRDETRSVSAGSECGLELQITQGDRAAIQEKDSIILYVQEQEQKPLGL
ncbi:translation initiation factor IF-2 [Patescibacteria group bacterium]|nr:translation initiation factor IF-2 [Patescibacteria group bacterium]